jgi:colicin import membrane protein
MKRRSASAWLPLIAALLASCAAPAPSGPGGANPPAQSPLSGGGDAALRAYVASIAARIRANIVVPPDAKGDPEAVFEVTQSRSGEVTAVRLLRASGTPSVDRAIERAIRISSPLPRAPRPELFGTTLNLRFRPLADGG